MSNTCYSIAEIEPTCLKTRHNTQINCAAIERLVLFPRGEWDLEHCYC